MCVLVKSFVVVYLVVIVWFCWFNLLMIVRVILWVDVGFWFVIKLLFMIRYGLKYFVFWNKVLCVCNCVLRRKGTILFLLIFFFFLLVKELIFLLFIRFFFLLFLVFMKVVVLWYIEVRILLLVYVFLMSVVNVGFLIKFYIVLWLSGKKMLE